jgi:heme-degrading monooxygenase HmoA
MVEVNPKSDEFENYFDATQMLSPELKQVDGFVDNTGYASLTRPGWLLSLSNWRDETSLKRWRIETNYHKRMQAAGDRVFADYRVHIGEVVVDTRVPAGQAVLQQRLDETDAGIGEAITLLDASFAPDWVKQAGADAVLKSLGFDPGAFELVGREVFEAAMTPGDVIALVKWEALATAEDTERFERDLTLPKGVRLRHIRVVRDD